MPQVVDLILAEAVDKFALLLAELHLGEEVRKSVILDDFDDVKFTLDEF